MNSKDVSVDDFLGGQVSLKQPKKGYRITSDSVFLAASIAPKEGDKILDVGAGSGAILSCLAARLGEDLKSITLQGVELQDDLISLARENGTDCITYFDGDILKDASRVIVRAQKDANGLLTLKSGMIVHKSDGTYSDQAENILRHACFLDITK